MHGTAQQFDLIKLGTCVRGSSSLLHRLYRTGGACGPASF